MNRIKKKFLFFCFFIISTRPNDYTELTEKKTFLEQVKKYTYKTISHPFCELVINLAVPNIIECGIVALGSTNEKEILKVRSNYARTCIGSTNRNKKFKAAITYASPCIGFVINKFALRPYLFQDNDKFRIQESVLIINMLKNNFISVSSIKGLFNL